MATRKLSSNEKHIRDAHRWAFAIIAMALLALTLGFIGQPSIATTISASDSTVAGSSPQK
jgi:hypothetical protein